MTRSKPAAREVPPEIAAMRATRGGPWRPPTRRTFLTMLGLAGATLGMAGAIRRGTGGSDPTALDPPRQTWTGTTRWIGHC